MKTPEVAYVPVFALSNVADFSVHMRRGAADRRIDKADTKTLKRAVATRRARAGRPRQSGGGIRSTPAFCKCDQADRSETSHQEC